MPPGTITIAGKTMNKNVVYFGGAVALGIVAYAWYKNGQEGPQILTADPNLAPVGEPQDIPGFSVYGPDNARIPQTNAEWYDLVISKAQAIGVDAAAMGAAVGKYLGRQPLTKAEIELVRMAIASSGNPPEGGPYNIIEVASGGVTPPPPPTTTPPPTNTPPPSGGITVPVTQGTVAVNPEGGDRYGVFANETPGATHYRVRWETASEASGWVGAHLGSYGYLGTFFWAFGVPNVQFAVRVQAGNAAGFDPHGIVSGPVYSRP